MVRVIGYNKENKVYTIFELYINRHTTRKYSYYLMILKGISAESKEITFSLRVTPWNNGLF